MNSEIQSSRQSTPVNKKIGAIKWLALFFLIVSSVGFLDSAYLTAKHFLGTPVPCSIFSGCEKVLSSPYSEISGIPLALIGGIFYLVFLIVTIIFFDFKKDEIITYLSYFSFAGLAASTWFVYVQFFVLHQICEFCMLSALTSALLFTGGIVYLMRKKKGGS